MMNNRITLEQFSLMQSATTLCGAHSFGSPLSDDHGTDAFAQFCSNQIHD